MTKRPNGTGNVYQRGSTWTARVVDHYVPSPASKSGLRPVWKTKGGFLRKKDAINYLPTLQTAPKEKRPPTLEHYWLSYSQNDLPKLSKSKQVAYRGAWKKLAPLARYRVDLLTVSILRDTVSEVANSYYTARDCKVLLNHLFELAGADGFVSKDLPSYIVLPELEETERQVFTDEEQTALWKLYESGDPDAPIPLVMIYTSMMPGELMRLNVSNIDIAHQVITGAGLKTKVRKSAPIILPRDIIPVVEDLIANARPNGDIFKRVEKDWYARYYAALEKAGCRRLEPYCCRHSTATRLAVTEGIAPQTIQRIMRWSSTKMLDRYAHPDASDLLAAANTITRPATEPDKSEPKNYSPPNPTLL